MNYADEATAHDARVRGLFDLYNARRFDDMLAFYSDDVMCFLPTVIAPGRDELKWSHGKDEYRYHLGIFYDLFGQLTVTGVFATGEGSSVMVTDERGNTGTFSFEVSPTERRVKRVFFHHQPKAGAAAA